MGTLQKRGNTYNLFFYDWSRLDSVGKPTYRCISLKVSTRKEAEAKQRQIEAENKELKRQLKEREKAIQHSRSLTEQERWHHYRDQLEAVHQRSQERQQVEKDEYAEFLAWKEAKEEEERNTLNPTMRQLWDLYVEWATDGNRSRNTLKGYNTAVNKFVATVGNIHVQDVNKETIATFVKHCKTKGAKGRKPLKQSGIKQYLICLQGIFSTAIDQGWYKGKNPFRVQWNRVRSTKVIGFLTPEEVDKMIKIAEERGERNTTLLIALAAYGGLRKDEVANLLISEVDFIKGEIRVREHDADPDEGIERSDLKTPKSRREIPLSSKLAKILEKYQPKDSKYWIVPPKKTVKVERGEYRFNWNAPQGFNKCVKLAGLDDHPDDITPHFLRHTFASVLLNKGRSIHKVSEWMGHTSVLVTQQVYGHLQKGYDPDVEF